MLTVIRFPDILRIGADLTMVLVFFGLALLLGDLIFRFSIAEDHPQRLFFSLGLGLGAFSLLALSLGLSHNFRPGMIRAVYIGVAIGVVLIVAWKPPKLSFRSLGFPDRTYFKPASSCILAALALMNLVGALGPIIFFDTLVYHFALPKLFLGQGKIFPIPGNVYSGMPLNTEMLYSVGLAFGGESFAKLIPWAMGLAVAALVFSWARGKGSERMALMTALLFYSCPMVSSQAWTAQVEVAWCFYYLLAITALISAVERRSGLKWRWLLLIGIFCGLAMGTKYNAATVLPIVASLEGLRLLGEDAPSYKRIVTEMVVITAVSLIVVAPWLIKNFLYYHNPVFPFLNDYFSAAPRGVNWRGLMADAQGRNLSAIVTDPRAALDIFSSIVSPRWLESDGLGLALICALPLVLAAPRKSWTEKALLLALGVSWLSWTLTSSMPRFFLFAVPVLSFELAAGLEAQGGLLTRTGPALILLLCGLAIAGNLSDMLSTASWRVVFGLVDSVYVFSDFGNFSSLKDFAIRAFVPCYTHNAAPASPA